MDKIQKFVHKLSAHEANRVLGAIARVQLGKLGTLDVKKLKGYASRYRVRVGRMRILFTRIGDRNIITDVDFRSDNTYS